jgi:hypothetical protein
MHCASVRDVCGVEFTADQNAQLERWLKLISGPTHFFVFGEFVICSERHESFSMDERGRLHSSDGPALRCRDGYEIYVWHGVRVDKRVITEPESFTREELNAERNSEIHRCLAEKLGWEKYLALRDLVTIDEWQDPKTGLDYQLLDTATRLGDEQPRFLRMRSPALHDGSQPHFVEPVHPELKTAQAARRWQIPVSSVADAKQIRHGDVVLTYAPPETISWPTPQWCNQNPKLAFQQEA